MVENLHNGGVEQLPGSVPLEHCDFDVSVNIFPSAKSQFDSGSTKPNQLNGQKLNPSTYEKVSESMHSLLLMSFARASLIAAPFLFFNVTPI